MASRSVVSKKPAYVTMFVWQSCFILLLGISLVRRPFSPKTKILKVSLLRRTLGSSAGELFCKARDTDWVCCQRSLSLKDRVDRPLESICKHSLFVGFLITLPFSYMGETESQELFLLVIQDHQAQSLMDDLDSWPGKIWVVTLWVVTLKKFLLDS